MLFRAAKSSKDLSDIERKAQAILAGKDNVVQQMGNLDPVYNAFVPKAVEAASTLQDAFRCNVKQEDMGALIPYVEDAEKWMFRTPECARKCATGYVGELDCDAFRWKLGWLNQMLTLLTENLKENTKLVRSAIEKLHRFDVKLTAQPRLVATIVRKVTTIRFGPVPIMRYVRKLSGENPDEVQDSGDLEVSIDNASPKTVDVVLKAMDLGSVEEAGLKFIKEKGMDVTLWANGHRLSRDQPVPDGCDVELVVVEVDKETELREGIFNECAKTSKMGLCLDEMLMLGCMIHVDPDQMRMIYDCVRADLSRDSDAGDAAIPKVKVLGLLQQYTLDEMKDFLQWGHENQDGVYCPGGHRYKSFRKFPDPSIHLECDICRIQEDQVPHMWFCKACEPCYVLCSKCFGESRPPPTQT